MAQLYRVSTIPSYVAFTHPSASFFFALAYWLNDWNLEAWRSLLLVADGLGLFLMFRLLKHLNRAPLWSALYWLNPLLIMQTYNAVHMDILLIPPLLAAVLMILQHRHNLATVLITIAAAIKLWPLMLLPFAFRPIITQPRILVSAILIALSLSILLIGPVFYYGLGEQSGLAAFSQTWQRNTGLFPLMVSLLSTFTEDAQSIYRLLVAISVGLLVICLNRKPAIQSSMVVKSICWAIIALFLLSPAQFPWYCIWFLPLLCLYPNPVLLLFTPLMPIYYLKFYFLSQQQQVWFDEVIVWFQYLPILLYLIFQGPTSLATRRTES